MYELARASGARREATLEEMGLVSREQAEARRAAPARVIEGAEYERTPAQAERKAHTRTYPGKSTAVTRPRTAEEAKARLAAGAATKHLSFLRVERR